MIAIFLVLVFILPASHLVCKSVNPAIGPGIWTGIGSTGVCATRRSLLLLLPGTPAPGSPRVSGHYSTSEWIDQLFDSTQRGAVRGMRLDLPPSAPTQFSLPSCFCIIMTLFLKKSVNRAIGPRIWAGIGPIEERNKAALAFAPPQHPRKRRSVSFGTSI